MIITETHEKIKFCLTCDVFNLSSQWKDVKLLFIDAFYIHTNRSILLYDQLPVVDLKRTDELKKKKINQFELNLCKDNKRQFVKWINGVSLKKSVNFF